MLINPSIQFIAGTEPTTSVLSFALLYMVREPDVQDRVRAEIHDVLGTSRFPESSDRQDLPFTEATIMEIQRMANVTPRGLLPHSNMGGPVKVNTALNEDSMCDIKLFKSSKAKVELARGRAKVLR